MSIDPQTRSALEQASTATIQTQLFKRGLRNTFLFGLRPMSASAHFVAEAFTLRYIPAREDLDVLEAFDDPDHPQRKAIETVGPGEVLVMDCRQQPRAASAGEILLTRLLVRGAAAMVTDGSIRDSHTLRTHDLPVYACARSATLNLALHHAVDMQVPIGCAGVAVYPGDVLVGDPEGVVVIPRMLADEVAGPAAEQQQLEDFILDRVRGGAPLRGNYPPSAVLRAQFHATS
jgi:regulator of RNase E activity RraA